MQTSLGRYEGCRFIAQSGSAQIETPCFLIRRVEEGEFVRLKLLLLENIDLVHCIADSIHFPLLEHLVIKELYCLKKIPSGIEEIQTLKLIDVHDRTISVVTSAKQMPKDRQENMGDDALKVQIVD
ncbi:Putative late blight resistance protein homolog R1B-13 [Olea europaea subsp. europaea]|uniref:Late blight resistance protein homolog R1B-13 n=1 Tax=Olea europaea subsp. europaea TaxID=158383 RepID=A0A8S0PVG6_OLEEU|nr:Putative late blight resistance protein homolog R1B-13 [Olea europaea subsp. europaea]